MIFFDLDETLFDFKAAEYLAVNNFFTQCIEQSNQHADDFYQLWCEVGKTHFDRFLRGELTFEQQKIERIQELFHRSGLQISDVHAQEYFQIYLNRFEENWKAFDDVIPTLAALSNHRLGIITNGDSAQQRQKLEKIGIMDYFQVIVAAGDIGISKPNTEIFEYACRLAEENPADCYYVGDNMDSDIIPCEKIKMRGIWLNRKNENKSHTRTIKRLNELQSQFT
ncbi:HAD family hydrolase [Paenibacillus sp. GYB006]|uniref:HAD family hydrolase n=1 Tax=Paenibacillus sp. GYB006 TaxID=2994394 RepID=UPI002F96814A